ncbi:MAG: imidazole glycerol phosphate synthase subunit HisH [Nitrospirae bacterium]|nr:MAG: imidazole glycerol phosphate synthase subunit HisH [Nitrospirota bacterium]
MIAIASFGIGNILSLTNMVRYIGFDAVVADKPGDLLCATKIILPGVGAFDYGMKRLSDLGWIDVLNEVVMQRRVPVLGICLGMQLMCRSSQEGNSKGLGWIAADVVRFDGAGLRVPHMGWNSIEVSNPNPLISSNYGEQRFYFCHSYHTVCDDPSDILATARHGYDFTAAFSCNNIYGVQFHPEKSHRFGMSLIKKFLEL